MSILIQLTQLIKKFIPNIKSQKDFDFAYLSNSNDACDLERRMRAIDQRSRSNSNSLVCGTSLL